MTGSREKVPKAGLPARKHLAHLGQFLLAVFLTALFFQLRILDSRAHREDFESITALASLAELPVHRVLAEKGDPHAEFDKAVQDRVTFWLKAKHPEVDQAHRQSRDTVVKWLREGGLRADEAGSLSGKGSDGSVPFLFFRTGVAPLHSQFGDEARLTENPPVGLLLDEARHLGAPLTLTVVQGVNPSDLPRLDFRISQNDFGWQEAATPNSYRLESVTLDDSDRLVITFVENSHTQRSPERRPYLIPVVTRAVSTDPILEIISSGLHAKRLTAVATDKGRYDHLYQTYGSLRLDNARTMTANRMLDSFQDVEILAFRFSPKYFWIFTSAFLAAALLAVAVHLRRALPDDEPTAFGLHALLDYVAFRVLFWCVIPPAAMLLARPQGIPLPWILAVYWIAFASLVATGVWLVWLSVHTSQQEGRSVRELPQGGPTGDRAVSRLAGEGGSEHATADSAR
jgi:hypothetical protein